MPEYELRIGLQETAQGTFVDLDPTLEALLARQPERLPFLHPAWLRTWLSEFGANYEPLVLSCSQGGNVLGVAPLMRNEGQLSFIGDPQICDFMDVVVDPENVDAAYEDLWKQLCEHDWGELELWGLMASSPTRERIKQFAAGKGFEVTEELEAVAPRLPLPESWEAYMATLGKKDRHELRRKIRKLYESGAGVSFDVLSTQDEVAGAMDEFMELHRSSRADKTEFMTPEMETFFRRMASAMAAEGLVRLFMLRINRKPAACVLCFDAGSYLYLYNSGYDPEFSSLSVGLVSKALCLQWAIENGKTGLDFLRGDEPYKYDMGAKNQEIYRIRVARSA